jgi:hypothetical protein
MNSRSKYRSKKITVNGITYDSKKEMRRHLELLEKERKGEIKDLQRQVKFVLIPSQYELYERYGKKGQRLKDGKRCIEKECAYVADFVYKENGNLVVEDTKGYRNPSTAGYAYFVLKRKLMLWVHGIRIREI